MNTVFWGLITLAVIVFVGVLITLVVELKSSLRSVNEFLKMAEGTLKPTLEELQLSLKSIRNVTDNITVVTEDVKVLSGSVRNVGDNVRQVTNLIGNVTTGSVIKASSLRVGITTAATVLLKGLLSRRSR